jgi:hypothetical protein
LIEKKYQIKGKDLYEIAKSRKDKEIRKKVPGTKDLPLLFYLDLWHLGKIIDIEWKLLENIFEGFWTKNEIQTRFSVLDVPRNRIAHCHVLRNTDVSLIKETLDFFSRNISNRPIEDLEDIYFLEKSSQNDYEIAIIELISCLQNNEVLPDNYDSMFIALEINNKDNKKITDQIKNIKNMLNTYSTKRAMIGNFEKAKEYVDESDIIDMLGNILKVN